MTQTSAAPQTSAPLAPVPVRARRDGWTPDRQAAFLEALRACRSPTRAAAAVGMSREGAYALRRRPDAAAFAYAWDAALRAPVPVRVAPRNFTKIITAPAACVNS